MTQEPTAMPQLDYSVTLPGGEQVTGQHPLVVIGPNGSGKTRQTRGIGASVGIEFINALRNTRVAQDLPAMGVEQAKANFASQKSQARQNHWDLSSDFDYMLSELLAEKSMVAIEFMRKWEQDPSSVGQAPRSVLTRVESLWGRVFPGRELHWRDWRPMVRNTSAGAPTEYLSNTMSDGEKAALYLAGRVLAAPAGILVVDEPETHFHSLLAVAFWTELEKERPDIRFVYVTHDLTFGLSRRGAQFVLASPIAGLRTISIDEELPSDIAHELLGSASFSFYASRIVFCEGDFESLDYRLYSSWFYGVDTVVRPVGSCTNVIRCAQALNTPGVAMSLTAMGIIDRDFHPDSYLGNLPTAILALPVHEVESLFCLPDVVAAVCAHVSRAFDPSALLSDLRTAASAQASRVTVERWKAAVEPQLQSLVGSVVSRNVAPSSLAQQMPSVFDMATWSFQPGQILQEEDRRIQDAVSTAPAHDLLRLVPGKALVDIAARHCGLTRDAYVDLIVSVLRESVSPLAIALGNALGNVLPARHAATAIPTPGLVDVAAPTL